jgi:MoxR-like ATPase
VNVKVPQASAQLAREVTAFIQEIRRADLFKAPGVAETLDWATALVALSQEKLDPKIVEETLGVILKYQDDVDKVKNQGIEALLERVSMIGF